MNLRFVSRIRILTLAILVIGLTVVGRLYVLQIMNGEAYAARAAAQFVLPAAPLLDRNIIYFSEKDGTEMYAAVLENGYAVAINPQKTDDADGLWEVFKDITPFSQEEFLRRINNTNTQYVRVAEHLGEEEGLALIAKDLPGVVVERDRWRLYPGGQLAAQTLGFVAYKGDAREGRYGLERYYEQTLAREPGNLYGNFFVELFGGVKKVLSGAPQTGSIVTTIEPSVQGELERTLAQYASQWAPKLSGGIVMDPHTGEIIAMAVNPTFDVNRFNEEKSPAIFANPLVENVYEMGSIMKPLTVAAGIDSGAITANTTYKDTGSIEMDGKTIRNFDGVARGVVPMQEVLSQSLNLGAAFIAGRMGRDSMREYFLDRYKFGQETGIDLPGEVHGLVQNLQGDTRDVEFATASFGQGLAVTPVEMVRAFAALANGGYLVTPHLVRAVRYDTGLTSEKAWNHDERILKSDTTAEVSRMLTKVVDEALLQGQIKLPRYSVAAKTGTAQIANPSGGGYYENRFLHSFFGYFPSYDARFVVFLFAVEPQGATFSSQTLAFPFNALTQFLISYYDIPPDR